LTKSLALDHRFDQGINQARLVPAPPLPPTNQKVMQCGLNRAPTPLGARKSRVVAARVASTDAGVGQVALGKTGEEEALVCLAIGVGGAGGGRVAPTPTPTPTPAAATHPLPTAQKTIRHTSSLPTTKKHTHKTGLKIAPLGVGAWSWGDRSAYWGYGKSYGKDDNKQAFDELQALAKAGKIPGGAAFIDTAEVYGYGESERFVGEFVKADASGAPPPFVCTKFAPLPWRVTQSQVLSAAKASAERLQAQQIDLYIQHWPGFFTSGFSNDSFLEGLADVADAGLARALGSSNFNASRVRAAADALERRGHCLSSNQVQYSLLYRAPETNGVLEACRERGVTLVAYSPLCQGLLTGKYVPGAPLPTGPRAAIYRQKIGEIARLLDLMRIVGEARGGKTPGQVALNWLMCSPKNGAAGVVPIPGAKNAAQLRDLVGACDWRLSGAEWDELDKESLKVKPPLGAPFENW